MQMSIRGLVLAELAAMTLGCAACGGAKAGPQSVKSANTAAGVKTCAMQSGGHDVLRVTVPVDATCERADGSLHMVSQNRYVDIWLVRGARTVDDGVGRVDHVITREFKEFKATGTTTLMVAGAPAKRLMGSGAEADDNDPGTADVVVFKVGANVFVACTHGEKLSAAAQQWMMVVVQSAAPQ